MRAIKINKNNIKFSRRIIDYYDVTEVESDNENVYVYEIKTRYNHCLNSGDYVTLFLDFSEFEPLIVSVVNSTTFIIEIPKYRTLDVSNVAMEGENALLVPRYNNYLGFLSDFDNIIIRYGGEEIEGKINASPDEIDGEIVSDDENLSAESIICEKPLSFYGDGVVWVKVNWHFNKEKKFNTLIEISNYDYYFDMDMTIENSLSYKLNDEQAILNGYFEDVKASIIPEIVDNEKQQFIPVSKIGDTYSPIREIEFNLHFRDRIDLDKNDGSLREGWSTTDEQYWNNVVFDDDTLKYKNNKYDDNFADSLDFLGFTEDDIRFNKTKIKKTFLRLLFYSSKEMLKKELLYYSTIFLDGGELYRIYNSIKSQELEIFDSGRTDNSLRLSAKFSVKNKYVTSKSSEGFYLYLFPSEIGNENSQRTIYMKVEFNHAGYGKTIPMMLPRDNDNSPIKLTDNNFPLNFTPEKDGMVDFDFDAYQNAVMIPINIGYNEKLKSYTYSFPFLSTEESCGKVVLNLFEPRIKG